MRLFIAVRFTPEIKELLKAAAVRLKQQSVSGNFTDPENLHLTLAFIGESDRVSLLRDCLDRSVLPPFSIALEGFGHFGTVWWIGIQKSRALELLAGKLRSALRESGFPMEERPFKPHITIARNVVASQKIRLSVPPASMPVTRISLMKSERIGGRLIYSELYGTQLK